MNNESEKDTSPTMSPREAAVTLEVGLNTIYGLLYSNKLAATKDQGGWHISAAAVEERRRRLRG